MGSVTATLGPESSVRVVNTNQEARLGCLALLDVGWMYASHVTDAARQRLHHFVEYYDLQYELLLETALDKLQRHNGK